jgi:hypothetical protein
VAEEQQYSSSLLLTLSDLHANHLIKSLNNASQRNTAAPYKVLTFFQECSDRAKQPPVACLFDRISTWPDLTPEQRGTIQAILTDEIPSFQPLIREVLVNRQKLEASTAVSHVLAGHPETMKSDRLG